MRDRYVEKVLEIHAEQPEYDLGGDGSGGKCDCVGLGIGALRRLGIEYDGLHGSNWAARHEAVELWKIEKVSDLRVGDNVLKAYEPGDPKWNLPERYRNGADQRDYYHFGVVVSVNPLQICHCTSPTTKIDTKLGRWSHAFLWKQLAEPVQEVDLVAICKRKVVLDSGHLNLRAGPSSGDRDIGDIPNGAVVEVLVDGGWPFIRYNGKTGYVCGQYLTPVSKTEAKEETREEDEVEVPEARKVTIIDSEGNRFEPVGDFRVLIGSID